MAHRGRLNVLANIVGKSYSQIFREFEGNIDPRTVQGSGDVKYHLGAEGEFTADSGAKIKVSVAANPSHLEAVDPVLEGIARAKQDVLNQGEAFPVLPLLVHGDAAFAGQGVVAETLNLSQLRGYRTGGTIHVVVNNQVGFTTSPAASRSSLYCTDVARMVQAPIFHVNGDDPEACIRVARLAFEYRQAFKKDVVIDLVCYRRRGHNEGDDPSYTQPLMYDLIEQKRSVRKLYTESLIGRGDITLEEAEQVLRDYQQQLERVFTEVREATSTPSEWTTVPDYPEKQPRGLQHRDPARDAQADRRRARQRARRLHRAPEGAPAAAAPRGRDRRRARSTGAPARSSRLGSLLMDGRPVRLAGQDSRRGTFVSRFATIIDRTNANEWTPLANLTEDQAQFYVYDSLLSEYAALGFEYGYSVARPDALVVWEAQFGDFVNGAQIVIDEFITSSQTKWRQQSGVVLLLPHGYEGQGPDHSSARIERFLTMAADDAFVVAQPSTPASLLPPAAPARARRGAPPADRLHPEVDAQAQGGGVAARGLHRGHGFRTVTPRRDGRPGEGAHPAAVQRPDHLGPDGRARQAAGRRADHRDRAGRAALPAPDRRAQGGDRALPATSSRCAGCRTSRSTWARAPFYRLNVFADLAAEGHEVEVISRPASSSPSVGQHSRHVEEQKSVLERAFA